ncbi:hypothetical protein DCS_07567 [Drechmeria coniospora]|uniref:Uncharacterized protein n=1 Tax=Drechmeria coniospora TaxID=98403 RepID=A0A151GET3_DRECN|nr:hypothetical protein DCS_07567 [Drechmeria coniospora]KYK55604.1 hypothetical protein DCS_07567 [Drechmeria coniospora]
MALVVTATRNHGAREIVVTMVGTIDVLADHEVLFPEIVTVLDVTATEAMNET